MTFEEAEKLAHGRVWTGRQAKENGLIDEVGGLDRAIEIAKELAEIPVEDGVTVVHYPEQKELIDIILSGEGNLATAAVRWVIYRFIRDDLAETWNMMTDNTVFYMEEVYFE